MSTPDLKARIAAQFGGSERHTIEVPEWAGDDGKPAVFTFTKATIGQIAEARRLADNDPVKFDVRLICLKLCDAEGQRVFAMTDWLWISENMDPMICGRLSRAIGGELAEESAEALEKN